MIKNLLFVTILAAASCNDPLPDIECNTNEEGTPSWLDEKIEQMHRADMQQAEVYTYKYKSETVIMINACVDCADSMTLVYNCAGTEICKFGGIAGFNTCPDFEATATDRKLYWKNY